MNNESGTTEETTKVEVQLIPHPDGENFPNTEYLMITTKPSKKSPVKYEIFETLTTLSDDILSQFWAHGMTIGQLIEQGMRNVSYRAPFGGVFDKAANPEALTQDEHRALQTCLDKYIAGARGVSKAEKDAKLVKDVKATIMEQLGLSPDQFERAVAKQAKKA